MTWLRRHPGDRLLNRFADGELGEQDHATVAAHLAACPRCREEVALVRRMRDMARSLPGPIATDEVLRRAIARRSAGERVLLPMTDAGPPARRHPRRFAPLATAAMLTLMVAGLVMSVRVLEADRPALRIHPERPVAGEALRVEYSGGALFADQSHLKLRGRYRTADDRHWQLLAGILVRGDDGLYRTEVQLPDSVVYAAFAVEDLYDGDRLDSNNRELWDVMVHGRDGRPTLAAMTARLRDLERRDWGEAYEVALAMTEAYPDEPQSWAIRFSFELGLFDRDSVVAAHRAQFERLEHVLTTAKGHDAAAKAWLGVYAIDLGRPEPGAKWIHTAVAENPEHPAVIDAEAMLLLISHASDPARRVAAMEEIWHRPGSRRSRTVVHGGWQAAVGARDYEAVRRWSRRYLDERPLEELSLLSTAYQDPEIRARLLARTRDFLADRSKWYQAARPLRLPLERHIRIESENLQRLLGRAAEAAALAEHPEDARSLATLGADVAWESEALIQFGRALVIAGDQAGSLDVLAKAGADPATARAAASLANSIAANGKWEALVADARTNLRNYLGADAVVRYLPAEVQLHYSGVRANLAEIHNGRITVVTFLSRFCAPALQEMAGLPELARAVEDLGAQLIVISTDNSNDLQVHLRSLGYDAPVYRDTWADGRSAFQSSATPDYFVLDSHARIRFQYSSASEVLRQVWFLQNSTEANRQIAAN